ncbi:MAG TPA: hypothetical protein VL443_24170 [Cyclobacteriaceae bacterium]|jgi:hypothetical protein|nr:hypothetical protein [Cyclobacteriaceae bacterium]
MQDEQKFDVWCLVELFGHQKIAGRVTERNLGGAAFLQVDVPENDTNPAFTRLLNPSAIYALNPIDEETARNYAKRLALAPITSWDVKDFMEKANKKLAAHVPVESEEDKEEEEYNDERDN